MDYRSVCRVFAVLAALWGAAAHGQEGRIDTGRIDTGRVDTGRIDTLSVPHDIALAAVVDSLAGERVPLELLVRAALQHNLGVRSTQLSVESSQQSLRAAQGGFAPLLNSSGAYALTNAANDVRSQQYSVGVQKRFAPGTALTLDLETTRSTVDTPAEDLTIYDTGLSLGFIQPLLQGYGLADEPVDRARTALAAASYRHGRSRQAVIAQIERAYWNLGEAEALEAVFWRSFKVAEVLLYRNTELNRRDLATDLDVLTAESGYELRRSNLIDARRARLDAAEALVYAVYGDEAADQLAAREQVIKTVGHAIRLPPPGAYEAAVAAAVERRLDLMAARQDLANAGLTVRLLGNALHPRLDLQGQAGTSGRRDGLGDAFEDLGSDMSWSVNLVFSEFIGNDVDRGAYEAARRVEEQQRLRVVELENGVRREVREALRAIESGLERLRSAARAADLGRRQLRAEQQRLDLGLGDSFRVLQTEENAAQAALAEVRARIGLAQAVTSYYFAVGRIGAPYGLEE